MIALGETDAKNAIAKGNGVSVEHLIHYHALKKTSHTSIEGMTLGDFLEAKESGSFDNNLEDLIKEPSVLKALLFNQ
jgi:hypothetical protein